MFFQYSPTLVGVKHQLCHVEAVVGRYGWLLGGVLAGGGGGEKVPVFGEIGLLFRVTGRTHDGGAVLLPPLLQPACTSLSTDSQVNTVKLGSVSKNTAKNTTCKLLQVSILVVT